MKVDLSQKENANVIHIEGNMDIHNTHKAENEFMEKVRSVKSGLLVMDLGGVGFISSAGLRLLVSTLKHCEENNVEMRIAALLPAVRKVFEIVDMDSMFPVFDTVDAALQN